MRLRAAPGGRAHANRGAGAHCDSNVYGNSRAHSNTHAYGNSRAHGKSHAHGDSRSRSPARAGVSGRT